MIAAPVVCLWGDEPYLVGRALAEVEAEALAGGDPTLNRTVFEAPGAKAPAVVAEARTLPFLGTRRLVLVKGVHQWSADEWRPLFPYLEKPNPSTCLVLVAESVDKRLTAGKLLLKVARVVECARPTERDLPGWVERLCREAGVRLHPRVSHALALRVGPDLQLLSQEVEKLRIFAGARGEVTEEELEALVGESRGTTVFALCDALGQRDLPAALKALRKLLRAGEPGPRLLLMIVRHFRFLWIARDALDRERRPDPRGLAAELAVRPFVADKLLVQARGWEGGEFSSVFGRFADADLAQKTGGGAEVLEALVLSLGRGPQRKRPGGGRGV